MHSWTSFSEVSVPALKAALRSAIVAASRSISFAEAAQRFHNHSATTNVIRPHAFISSSATLNAPTSYLVRTTAHNYVREPRAKPRRPANTVVQRLHPIRMHSLACVRGTHPRSKLADL